LSGKRCYRAADQRESGPYDQRYRPEDGRRGGSGIRASRFWWFDWNPELQRFATRVLIYLALMDDRYPSTDDHQSVRLDYAYPDAARDLNRWLPLVKWLLAIPHYIVLFFLDIAALVVVIVAWFAIVVTGRYPRGLFGFVEGVTRWHNRVIGYAVTLVTDAYPPFRLAP
jgi:hypothetical protein